ncbi:cysteine-rich small domain-containing protein [Clostridiaceae bacterium HSG29]|nr:cysteine-rich small domain-containing protein [Clostridiaceae bacterium HSG29]
MSMKYKYFEHKECEYFPCHTYPHKDFNCLFCYCPLYPFKDCGGNYEMLDKIKDCSNCILPHRPENYNYIIDKLYEKMLDK